MPRRHLILVLVSLKMKKLLSTILIILIGYVGLMAQKKPELKVTVDAKEVAMGDYFQLTYSLKEMEGRNFNLPRIHAFLVQGPKVSSQYQNFNGKISFEQIYVYTLMPKKVGTFTIPPATIKVNGKTVRSNAVQIKVVKSRGQNFNQKVDVSKGLGIIAELTKETAYVGEGVNLDFTIYTRVDVNSMKVLQSPKFKGVFTEDVQELGGGSSKKMLDGVPYTTKLVRRMILTPQQEGDIIIDPMTVRVGTSRGPFDYKNETLISNSLTLKVKTLPEPKPEDFSGTVGKYEIVATINQNQLTTDETLILSVEISGKGDVKRIAAPQLNLEKDKFDIYDPRINDSFYEENSEKIYTRTFEYLISPKEEGNYTFAPSYTFFNPETEAYETVKETDLEISVLKGTGVAKSPTQELQGDIRFIDMRTSLHNQSSFYGSTLFWILLGLPFLALGGLIFYKQQLVKDDKIDPIIKRRNKAQQVATQRLSKAQEHLNTNDSRQFYDEIAKTLWGYVSNKLNIPASELSKSNIREQLTTNNIDNQYVDQFLNILENCEMALFAGMDNSENMQKTYSTVEELLVKMEG